MIDPSTAGAKSLSGSHLDVTRTPVVWIAEPTYEIEYANPAALALLGLSDPNELGSIVLPEELVVTGLTRTGDLRFELLETVVRVASDPEAWFAPGPENVASMAEVVPGEVDGRQGFWVSVPSPSSLNESQQALLEAGQVAVLFYDAVPAHVFMKDVSGHYMAVNRAFRSTFQQSEASILGRTDRDLMGSIPASRILEINDARVLETRAVVEYETALIVKSKVLHFRMVTFPIIRQGEVVAIGGVGLDQTNRINQERALAESESQFRLAFDNANYGLAIVSIDGRFVRVNEKFCEIWGRPAEELVGFHTDDFAFPDEEKVTYAEVFARASGNNDATQFEKLVLRGDGTMARVNVSSALIRDADGKALRFISHATDITEQRRLEERVRHGEKLEALGQLAGGIAHDINNLLGGMLGLSEMIGMMVEDQPQVKERCDQLEAAVHRASDFTGRLLAYSRTSTSRRETVDVHAAIESVHALVARSFEPNIEFRVDLGASPSTITGDISDIESALMNLAMNARDAMPDGGVLSITTSNVYGRNTDGSNVNVKIDVRDTGMGMSAEVKSRAFEPFFTTKGRDRGTGLGLASVSNAVHAHGGTIDLWSEVGHGTNFTITIPSDTDVDSPTEVVPPIGGHVKGTSVLVVDDDEVLREVMVDILRLAGCTVTHANDGVAAVELLEGGLVPDVLVFDLMMPRMGGLELFGRTREFCPSVVGILVTGYSIDEKAEQLRNEGVSQILQKPFRRDDLLRAMGLSMNT